MDDVIVTTIVQPPGGMADPDAIVIVVAVTVTPVHVPVLPDVVVTPAGIVSVNAAVSVSGAAVGLPSESVSVAVPPGAIVDGAIDFVSVGPEPVTVIGADAGGAVPPPVCSGPVVLVTVPGVDDVIVTTIVQPPGGIADPDAIVIVVGATVTPVQVPVLPDVVVTPAGIGSTNCSESVSGVAFGLPSESVSVAVPPGAIDAGAIVFASVAAAVVTVSGALAGGVVPPSVCTLLVVLVTVPGVDDVIVTTIVQPPGGIVEPAALVISVGATVTAWHEPSLATDVMVTPAGIASVNGAASVTAVALAFASVIVSVEVPPATIVAGRIVLPSADPDAVTVSGALAAGVVPPPVCTVLVVLVTVPGVDDVIPTTIVQPPTGIVPPDAIVISAGATVTPVQVPVLPDVVVTPAGIGSVKSAESVSAVAFGLPSVSVSVDAPPDTMVAGRIVLLSVAAAAVTVSGAAAGVVVPAPVVSVPVVLVTVPGVVDVIDTTIVQPPAGIVEPDGSVISAGATVTPVQVPVLPDVVVTPAGIGSVKSAESVSAVAFGLPRFSVSVAVPPDTMVAGRIVLPRVAIAALTVRGALAGDAVPALVCRLPVVLVTVPGVVDVMVTTIVQPPAGRTVPDAIVIVVAVTVTAVHVPVLPDVVVTPDGIVSVKSADSASGSAFGLPSVIVSVAVPPDVMVAGAIALPSTGGDSGTGVALPVSLPGFGSGVGEDTVAVFVYGPLALTVAVICSVALPGKASVPIVQRPVPLL